MKLPIASKGALALGLALGACSSVPPVTPVKNESAPPADLASAIQAAQLQRRNGDLTGATKILSQIMLVAPDDPRVVGEYGKVLVDKGQSGDALAFLARAIELQPGDWMLFSAQGVAYSQAGNYQAAQGAFARALQLNPGEPAVLNNEALAYLQTGDLDGAERLLLQAKPDAPGYARIRQNLALVQEMRGSRRAVSAAPVVATPAPVPAAPAQIAEAVPLAAAPVEQMSVAAPPAFVVRATPVPDIAPRAPAAKQTAPVKTASVPPQSSAGTRFVQISAFFVEDQAVRAAAELAAWNAHVFRGMSAGNPVFRVRLGPFATESDARAALAAIRSAGRADAILVTDASAAPLVSKPAKATAPVYTPAPPSLRMSQNSATKGAK